MAKPMCQPAARVARATLAAALVACLLLPLASGQNVMDGGNDANNSSSSSSSSSSRVLSVAARGACNWVSGGRWVVDKSLPWYTGLSCPYVRGSQNCGKIGRADMSFQKLRFQPDGCTLARMNPVLLATKLRNKLVVVYGDSVSKNLASSIFCILNAVRALVPWSAIINGRQVSGLRLPGYNVRVASYFSNNLNKITAIPGVYGHRVDLNALDPAITDLVNAVNVMIFQASSWWIVKNQYYQGGKQVMLSNEDAYKAGMTYLKNYLTRVGYKGIPIFMTISPTHYQLPPGLGQRTGQCAVAKPLTLAQVAGLEKADAFTSRWVATQRQLAANSILRLVDITHMSRFRADGHIADTGRKPGALRQDCLHWCEGGVTDQWVEAIYQKL